MSSMSTSYLPLWVNEPTRTFATNDTEHTYPMAQSEYTAVAHMLNRLEHRKNKNWDAYDMITNTQKDVVKHFPHATDTVGADVESTGADPKSFFRHVTGETIDGFRQLSRSGHDVGEWNSFVATHHQALDGLGVPTGGQTKGDGLDETAIRRHVEHLRTMAPDGESSKHSIASCEE